MPLDCAATATMAAISFTMVNCIFLPFLRERERMVAVGWISNNNKIGQSLWTASHQSTVAGCHWFSGAHFSRLQRGDHSASIIRVLQPCGNVAAVCVQGRINTCRTGTSFEFLQQNTTASLGYYIALVCRLHIHLLLKHEHAQKKRTLHYTC